MLADRSMEGLEAQELEAKNAFDKIDEDDNGYIMIGELHGLAADMGLPITPEEQDQALEALDPDNDGVFDREKWTEWWVRRWKANPNGEEEGGLSEEESSRGASAGQADSEEGQTRSGGGRGERINELTERAQQARRRAGTDIHTAAWRGDLALVKGFLEDDPELANATDVSEFGTGYRPLHYAAYGGFLDVCEELHAAGARALAAGDNGVTALFLAAQAGKAGVVRFLLGLGADPTAQERESGLCAMDVVDESCPDIFQQMQEKGEFRPPAPLEVPPTVTRVGPTSLQVAFLPLPEARGALPITRYKVKVEHDGAPGAGIDQAVTAAPGTEPSTPATGANTNTADAATSSGRIEPAGGGGDAAAIGADANNGDFANPTLAQVVLVPACEVPAHPTSAGVAADGEQQRQGYARRRSRACVTIRGLKPTTRYRVQVAGVNAIGFGPYGPASAAVVTPNKAAEEEDDRSAAKGTVSSAGGSNRARIEKGKGRQVLAMERRRSLAAQATRLQEQQQREAEERRARRAQKRAQSGSARTSGRPLAATTGGTGWHGEAGGAVGASQNRKMQQRSLRGGANQTQPLRQLPRHQRPQDCNENVDGTPGGATGSDVGSYYYDDLTESTDSPQHRPQRPQCQGNSNGSSARFAERGAAHRETNTSTRAAKTTPTPRRSEPQAVAPAPAVAPPAAHQRGVAHRRQPRKHRTQGSRPATTGASGHRGRAGGGGDDDSDGTENLSASRSRAGQARLVATAPASGVAAEATGVAEPRYSAARIAGEMSSRAYRLRNDPEDNKSNNNRSSREQPPSIFAEKRRAATSRPGGSQPTGDAVPGGSGRGGGAGHRQRQRRRPGGGDGGGGSGGGGGRGGCRASSSDVSVSSCGDMTISSEEHEGEAMAYTG